MGLHVLLTQTCTVERYLGEGAYGPRYAAPITMACRAEDVTEVVRDDTGEEVLSTSRVFTEPSDAVNPRARVTVNDGVARTAVTVGRAFGRDAVHHLDVRLR